MKLDRYMKVTFPLTVFFILSFLLFYTPIQAREISNHNYDDQMLVRMHPKWAGRFYEMFKVIDHILSKHNILYTLSGGSLLGAVRHEGIIPWDHDGDIDILDEDYDELLSLKEEFKKYDLDLVVVQGGHIVIEGSLLHTHKKLSIDVFQFGYKENANRYHLVNHFSKAIVYPKWNYLPSEYSEVRKAPFGPIELNIPMNPMGILYRYYGENVFNIACHYPNNSMLIKFYDIEKPNHPLGNDIYLNMKLVTTTPAEFEPVDTRVNLNSNPLDESIFNKNTSPFNSH